MSTNSVLVPASLMSEFLATEKIATRRWLQCQMESLLDHVFDQLSTKFEDYVASRGIVGTGDDFKMDSKGFEHEHQTPLLHENSQLEFQATADHVINTELPVAVGQSQNRDYRDQMMDSDGQLSLDRIHSETLAYDQPLYPQSLSVSTMNPELSNQNDGDDEYDLDGGDDDRSLDIDEDGVDARVDSPEEFEDTDNQLITTKSSSLFEPSSNEQSNQITIIKCEDEEDCDCDESLNGIEVKNDVGNDGGSTVEWIEDNEEPSSPKKKPRLDTTQPNHEPRMDQQALSKTVLTEDADETTNQVNNTNHDKHFLTLSLQCLQTDCPLMFNTKLELITHMRIQHDIHPYRCLVKDCKQSFSTQYHLAEHIAQLHPSTTTKWHCDNCAKHYLSYARLYAHNYQLHQLGLYRCTFANCEFTGGNKQKVADHYRNQHKPARTTTTTEFTCEQPNCGRRFNKSSSFKEHQRSHTGIKPYRCKWSDCSYASACRSNTIAHIKRIHLTSDILSKVDPKKYLEVLRHLL